MTEKIVSIAFLAAGAYVAKHNYDEDHWRENGITQLAPDRTAGEKAIGYAMAAALIFAGATLWKHSD